LVMPKCPNCKAHAQQPDKEWNFGQFRVKMYKCTKCGNQFREHFKGNTLKFVLSAHNGGLGRVTVSKETTDRHKSYKRLFFSRFISGVRRKRWKIIWRLHATSNRERSKLLYLSFFSCAESSIRKCWAFTSPASAKRSVGSTGLCYSAFNG
jgi:hypothetical protein